tara:strand:- start:68 stop:517 length:450 start_codon:yes stop_codon:yes gene_type:complete
MPKLKFKTDKMFTDITDEIEAILPNKFEGLVNVYSPHTTCCIWQTENEILHLVDVRFFLDKQVPYVKQPEGEHRNVKYLHDMMSLRPEVPEDEKINGHSHIRSMFFNSSENIPVKDNKLLVGKWKRLFFVELDPVRERELIVTFINGNI